MKTNKPETESTKRNRYTLQFKEQAIDRAKRDGVPQAARDYALPNRYCMAGFFKKALEALYYES